MHIWIWSSREPTSGTCAASMQKHRPGLAEEGACGSCSHGNSRQPSGRTQQLDRQSPGQHHYLKSAQRWRSHRRGLGEIRCLEPWTPRGSECAAGKDPDLSIQSLGDSSRAASIGCPRGPLAWHTWPYNGQFCWVVMPNCFDSFIHPLSSLFSLSLPVIFTEYLQLSC